MRNKTLRMTRAMRTALLVLLLSAMGMGKMYAQDFTVGDLNYSVNDDGISVTVTGHGYGISGTLVIPESVSYGGNTYSVTSIGDDAFEYCGGLTSVTIGNSVTSIGNYAFYVCSGLTSVTIGNSVTSIGDSAFSICSGLTSVTIPNSVTSIGDGAFYLCSGLTSIIIPDSVTSIGDNAFEDCDGLTSVTIPNSVISIGDEAFRSCGGLTSVTIGNSVTSIGNGAFARCSGLTSVTIGNSVTSIGDRAFGGCSGLEQITVAAGNQYYDSRNGCNAIIETNTNTLVCGCKNTVIPNSVTSIGDHAFLGCEGLTSIEIPNSVTSIGDDAFYYCIGLTSIEIPNSVTSIGDDAFSYCSGLTSIEIPNSVTSIGHSAFEYCSGLTSVTIGNSVTSIANYAFADCVGLTSINIPNSVTSIGGFAFAGCVGLTSINIPNSVTYIGDSAFRGCRSLTSINIPDSVTSIGVSAFSECSGLTSIIIPDSVTSIGKSAFSGCSGLTSVTIGKSVTEINQNAFAGCPNIKEINFNAQNFDMYYYDNEEEIWEDCTDVAINFMDGITVVYDWWAGSEILTSVSFSNSVVLIDEEAFRYCENLKTVTMGHSVETIGNYAFEYCSSLTSVEIPNTVSFIGDDAFKGCTRLTTIYYNAETIVYDDDEYEAGSAFVDCPNLTTIYIGADVKQIPDFIFEECSTVHLVVALGTAPAILELGAFDDFSDNTMLMVPCDKRMTYYAAWNMFPFNNIIEDCSSYPVNVGVVGTGGNVSVSATEVQMGQTVVVTVMPNAGMALSSITATNVSNPSQIVPIMPVAGTANNFSFVMPPYGVVVMATFKSSGASVDENGGVAPVSVYPNPTNGHIKIEAEDLKHVSICNMLGQTVYEGKACGNAFEYDFNGHGAGLYLVRIETANGVVVKRVSVSL